MVIGGKTQHLTRVQEMPKEIQEKLIRMRDDFLWEGKKPRIAHHTRCLSQRGRKKILDIHARNEAIDLWNLKEFLRDGDDRSNWPFFVEHTIINRWDMNQAVGRQGSLHKVFLQSIHIPSWRKDPFAYDTRRMIQAAKNHRLEFTRLSISKEIQLQMPVWSHIALIEHKFENIRRREAVKCLRLNHRTRNVRDVVDIARRRTNVPRKPHVFNPSGIRRRNCGCPPCRRDRTEYGCDNPGQCAEAARTLLECIRPKWNPLTAGNDLCEHLILSEMEKNRNERGREDQDVQMTFDPDFRVTDLSHGFRIFVFEDHTTQIPAKRYSLLDPTSTTVDVYLHAKVNNPGQMSAEMQAMLLVQSRDDV